MSPEREGAEPEWEGGKRLGEGRLDKLDLAARALSSPSPPSPSPASQILLRPSDGFFFSFGGRSTVAANSDPFRLGTYS